MTDGTTEAKYKSFIEEMNAVQVRKTVNEKTIAILVFGACENHGDHMPFGSDFIFPTEIAKRLATKVNNVNPFFMIFSFRRIAVKLHDGIC